MHIYGVCSPPRARKTRNNRSCVPMRIDSNMTDWRSESCRCQEVSRFLGKTRRIHLQSYTVRIVVQRIHLPEEIGCIYRYSTAPRCCTDRSGSTCAFLPTAIFVPAVTQRIKIAQHWLSKQVLGLQRSIVHSVGNICHHFSVPLD